MAVLNISNVTADGGVVLNDLKLLELIQMYPFLYNRRVQPFEDPDYDHWAWENITTSFNRSYKDTRKTFNTESLQSRWAELQPIVISLSKVHDISVIPHALRQIVVKIAVQLEDTVTDAPIKVPSVAESIILANIDMVSKLPLSERKKLEAEIMDLLLNTELSSKGTVKLSTIDMLRIEQQYESCLIDMGLKKRLLGYTLDPISTTDGNDTRQEENNSLAILQTILCDKSDSSPLLDDVPRTPTPPSGKEIIHTPQKKNKKRFLHEATQMPQIRPCVVRLKRYNFDNYLLQPKIKKEH